MKVFKKIYIRDKVFLEKRGNSYFSLGNPISLAKKLREEYDGLYIIDLNLKTGKNIVNFDVYDALTSIIFIQIDAERNLGEEVKKLYEINARVTFYDGFESSLVDKKFSAVFVNKREEYSEFRDVILKDEKLINWFYEKEKRIFFMGRSKDKRIFCEIV